MMLPLFPVIEIEAKRGLARTALFQRVFREGVADAVSVVLVGVDVLGVARESDVQAVRADLGREGRPARRGLRIARDVARQGVLSPAMS